MDTFQANAKTTEDLKKTLKQIPHSAGVYVYRDIEGTIIYVGKAIDLSKRVHQYFRDSNLPPKTHILVSQVADIRTHKTLSEFDALLLEAKLIYEYQPKYNVLAKDDKSPLYIKLTLSEELPRILYIRKPKLPTYGAVKEGGDVVFGPFQSAKFVRSIMRSLRHSIPYCTQKIRNGRPCFYTQIGLCDPCPSIIGSMANTEERSQLVAKYRRNMFHLRDMLSGKSQSVINELVKEMKLYARDSKFEEATRIRNQLYGLYELLAKQYDPMQYIQIDSKAEDLAQVELDSLIHVLKQFFPTINALDRIECIDISNTGGLNATGSLVVLVRGIPDTASYRRFKIQMKNAPNDVAMIGEVVERRFKRKGWTLPDLFIVDGGKGQVSKASGVLKEKGINVPVIGLAKRFEEIVISDNMGKFHIVRLSLTDPAIRILTRIRDEAHRFAIGYHRFVRASAFLPSS